MSERVNLKRIPIDHLKTSWISVGDLFKRGNTPRVFFDGQHLARPLREQATRQTTGARTDLKHIASRKVACLARDLGREVEIKQEVLAKGFTGRKLMIGDHLSQRREAIYGGHSVMFLNACVPFDRPCAMLR